MNNENIKWLTTVPASDCNFKSHLKAATVEEIKQAIEICKNQRNSKTKMIALERELKRRAKHDRN